ncbi:hypothetical protein KP509_32G043300 [Ceratopteris richardii]|nr:hypothetical protein KP509_32G043300 [Ceratopteris richardii]
MKDRWFWIAEGSFPLVPYHGEENNTYRELDPGTRVIILRALCEARLDQDDVRTFIDDKLKQGTSLSYIRKERTGIDMQGTTYWYENDPIAGQRLYRELRNSDNKEKTKLRGRGMPPPNPCQWETLATDLDEFLSVADKLSLSKNRMEVAIGKRINNDIVPEITELQKRRERALKKQQRQAQLLDSFLNTESMTAGRSRRDRKPVTYTFDDYDKSISEAIKITKRRQNSPEIPAARERKISNGVSRQHTDELESNSMDDEDQLETSSGMKRADGTSPSKQYESGIQSSESELSGDRLFGRGRRLRKPQKYRESEFIDPTFGDEAGLSSAEDIEGEALYDEGYRLKKRRVDDSSDGDDGDDEYRGDEDDEEDFDDEDEEEDDDYFGSSDEGESNWKRRSSKSTGRGRTRVTSKADRFSNSGLRRSQRATRSHIDYSKYEESDQSEEDRNDPISPDRVDSDTGAALANCRENGAIESMYVSNGQHMDKAGATEGTDDVSKAIECDLPENAVKDICVRENMNMIDAPHSSANEAKSEPLLDVKPDVKMHTFLDLNVAAPMIGGLDETCDGPYGHPSLFPVEKIQISGDDGSIYDPPKMVTEGLKR